MNNMELSPQNQNKIGNAIVDHIYVFLIKIFYTYTILPPSNDNE